MSIRNDPNSVESNWVPTGKPEHDLAAHRVAAKRIIFKTLQQEVFLVFCRFFDILAVFGIFDRFLVSLVFLRFF